MAKSKAASGSVPMTPREIVDELDKYIIGQDAAKRAVAIALRNRWRRMQLDETLRTEILPKNILMIGPTGVGKTEVARRLAYLANAPFIKVEATKFTEVGYVGRDVESIIRDLMEVSVKMMREKALERVEPAANEAAIERLLDAMLKSAREEQKPIKEAKESAEVIVTDGAVDVTVIQQVDVENQPQVEPAFDAQKAREDLEKGKRAKKEEESRARAIFRKKLLNGELDDKEIEVDISNAPIGVEIMAPPGMEEMTSQLQNMFQNLSSDRKRSRRMKVKDAWKQIKDDEAMYLVDEEDIQTQAVECVQENGIVFIDEIDKIVRRSDYTGVDVSREGVQRDLLPLVEGCTVFTKYGAVKTDHILFIASGAFHYAKPSDLAPELQGRLPIRVELSALRVEDFVRILTEPNASLTEQYTALMWTEGVKLSFTKGAIQRIAEVAYQVNEGTENIGARRLHTVMERLQEVISFEATERSGESHSVDQAYVNDHLEKLVKDEDLSRYIL